MACSRGLGSSVLCCPCCRCRAMRGRHPARRVAADNPVRHPASLTGPAPSGPSHPDRQTRPLSLSLSLSPRPTWTRPAPRPAAPDSDYSRLPCSLHTSPVTRSHSPLLAADVPSPPPTSGVPRQRRRPRSAPPQAAPPRRKSTPGNAANNDDDDDADAPLCTLTSRTQSQEYDFVQKMSVLYILGI